MIRYCLILLTLLIVSSNASRAEPARPYRIGVDYGFSGAAQVWSDYGRMGLELARDEINKRGGIRGVPMELVFEDSRTNPAQSVSAYRKLVTVDRVNFVIGNVWSFITNPLIPLSAVDRVPLISPTVMDASVDQRSDYFFTMGYRIDSIRDAVKQFFIVNQDIKSVAILCWDDAWGQAHLKLWKEVAQTQGVTVVDEVCQSDFANDYRTDITRIAGKRPGAVITSMYADRVLQRMREQRMTGKLLTTSDMVEAISVRNAQPSLVEGAYFTYWKPSESFTEAFRAKYNKEPILEAHNHYEVLRSIARALESNPTAPLMGLRSVKYEGVAGAIDFTRGPFANYGNGKLYRVYEGNLVAVE